MKIGKVEFELPHISFPKKEDYSLGMFDIATLITTMIMVIVFGMAEYNNPVLYWIKVILLLVIAAQTILLAMNDRLLTGFLGYILSVHSDSEIDMAKELLMIDEYLDIYGTMFINTFYEVGKIVKKPISPLDKIYLLLKIYLYRIRNGRISVPLSIWLFLYAVYLILAYPNYFEVPLPINTLIIFAFQMILCIAKGNSSGIGRVIGEIFDKVKYCKEEPRPRIRKIVHSIKLLLMRYNKTANKIEKELGVKIRDIVCGNCKLQCHSIPEKS